MTATYFRHGAGHSLNGRRAHEEGRFPATHAAKALGISIKLLREVADPCEWHHVGKYATRCDYYDTTEQPATVCRVVLARKLKPETRAVWGTLLAEAVERDAAEDREIADSHIRFAASRGYTALNGDDAGDWIAAHVDCDATQARIAARRDMARRAICWDAERLDCLVA